MGGNRINISVPCCQFASISYCPSIGNPQVTSILSSPNTLPLYISRFVDVDVDVVAPAQLSCSFYQEFLLPQLLPAPPSNYPRASRNKSEAKAPPLERINLSMQCQMHTILSLSSPTRVRLHLVSRRIVQPRALHDPLETPQLTLTPHPEWRYRSLLG